MPSPHPLLDAWGQLQQANRLSQVRASRARHSPYLSRICAALQPGERLVLTNEGPGAAVLETETTEPQKITITVYLDEEGRQSYRVEDESNG